MYASFYFSFPTLHSLIHLSFSDFICSILLFLSFYRKLKVLHFMYTRIIFSLHRLNHLRFILLFNINVGLSLTFIVSTSFLKCIIIFF